MANDIDKTDPTFVKDLLESDLYKNLVALWLSHEGWNVTIFATKVRPTSQERFDYSDEGDLEIWKPGHNKIRVEVKHNEFMFTKADDCPFESCIVETAYKMNKIMEAGQRFVVIRLNLNLTHCIVIRQITFKHWTTKTWENQKSHRDNTCYMIPKDKCEYRPLPGYVRAWYKIITGGDNDN
jgi:hypothetical protein